MSYAEDAAFSIRVNGVILCTAYGDDRTGSDYQQATCSSLVQLTEGKILFRPEHVLVIVERWKMKR